MRKEIIVAILVGIIFGGIFAFGIRRANVALNPSEEQNIASQDQNSTTSNNESSSADGLTILSPEQNDVITEDIVTITGITQPNSTIVISAENEDFVLKIDETGEFTQEIELLGGLNHVLINAYVNDQIVGEEVVSIVYTTEIEI